MNTMFKTLNLKGFGIDEKLIEIWANYYKEDKDPISPIYQIELIKNEVTYLSLNPSLRPGDFLKPERGYKPAKPYPLIYESTKSKHDSFFKKFFNIGIEPWTVLDLLYIRESSQLKLSEMFDSKTIEASDKDFLIKQMRLTFDILSEIQPKVVIVSNAMTDRLLHKYISDLNLIQQLPSQENGWIYKINNIPFITNEGRFLGSRFLQNKTERVERLKNEILRIINQYDFAVI